ncbi:MAG: hypothetical protein ACREH6_11335, partial [Geminicoccaceae bacterium]
VEGRAPRASLPRSRAEVHPAEAERRSGHATRQAPADSMSSSVAWRRLQIGICSLARGPAIV